MLRAILREQEIRRLIGVPGIGDRLVEGLATLGAAADRCLYFINKPATDEICGSLAASRECIIIAPRVSGLSGELGDALILEVADPRAAIAQVLGFIRAEQRQQPWVTTQTIAADAKISPLAVVEENVDIGSGVAIGPFCTIGADVSIGRGSILEAGVRVGPHVSIGEESIIGANVVIGAEGYGFVRDEAGNKMRIPHLGGIVIGSHVEIGALSLVQYGTISPTLIEDHVKIDHYVEVGHNVRIARGASVTGGVIIGGSAVIGEEAWIGINSSIRNGRQVGRRSLVGMDVSVQSDLPENTVARAPRPDVKPRDDDDAAVIGFG